MRASDFSATRSLALPFPSILWAMVVALLLAPNLLAAEELPQSARASALLIPPALETGGVDAFRFPQAIADVPPGLLAVGLWDGNLYANSPSPWVITSDTDRRAHRIAPTGLLARGSLGNAPVAYLTRPSARSEILREYEERSPLQCVAAATSLADWTVGAALSWATQGTKREEREQTGLTSGVAWLREFRTVDLRRFRVGVAREFTWGRIDIAGGISQTHFDYKAAALRRITSGGLSGTINQDLDLGLNHRPEFAARLHGRIAADSYWTTYYATTFGGLDVHLTERSTLASRWDVVEESYESIRGSLPRSEWTWGCAIGLPTPRRGRGLFHGSVGESYSTRIEEGRMRFFDRVPRETHNASARAIELGFAGWWPAPGQLEVLAGLRLQSTENRQVERQSGDRESIAPLFAADPQEEVVRFADEGRAFSSSFGWGLSRTFGSITLTGALVSRLSPLYLFSTVDVRIAL